MAPRARRKADRRPIYSAAAPPSSMGRSSPSTRTACRTWPPGRTGPRPGRRIHGRDRPRPGRPGLHAQTSTYQPGRGPPDWIKRPVALTQEVVPIGWQPGEGRRADLIGSILFAVHDRDGVLRYAGHVGTGFTPKPRYAISPATSCARHRRATAAGDISREQARDGRWLRPELVGEVQFRNWTPRRPTPPPQLTLATGPTRTRRTFNVHSHSTRRDPAAPQGRTTNTHG
jgi:ATP dependent DNA ligase C terminal region